MKLAFSSNAYMHFSIEETIAQIATAGYKGIEILADVPHAWPAGLLEERKESIRQTLDTHQLTISNINAFMYSFEKMFNRRIAEIESLLLAARASRSASSVCGRWPRGSTKREIMPCTAVGGQSLAARSPPR